MKTLNKIFTIVLAILAFTFTTNINALGNGNNGNGIGGDNGATKEHSALVNENNNGKAGEGNNGLGVGNMPYGNQGSNGNPNGRTGTRNTPSVPLDGGLSILLAGAAFFGIRKLRNK